MTSANLYLHMMRHKDSTEDIDCRNSSWRYVPMAAGEGIRCLNCGAILALSCAVPGCTHTRGVRKGEESYGVREWWVCGEHWRLVPRWMKAIVIRARKRARRLDTPAAWAAVDRLNRRTRRAAIQRALGI